VTALEEHDPRPTPVTLTEDPPAARAGDAAQIGRYTLLGLLGRGGMGVVHVARDELLGRRIALKLLDVWPADSHGRARLLREAQALARLSHPNVVTIHEAGEHDDRVYLTMELIAGATLRVWLRERRRTTAALLDVAVQAGRGLAAAHDAGLVHRDVKPDNIMVGDDGRVRVTDFGLARLAHADDRYDLAVDAPPRSPELTAVGAVLGTPGYMAPEQRQGRTAAASDIYSYCVVLVELFTGDRPAPEADASALRAALQGGVARGALPAWLAAILARGLDPAPDRRWPTMHALLTALERAVARRRRVRRFAAAAAGTLVVAGLALGGVALRERLQRDRAESQAQARLAAIARADDPDAAFARFVAEPENQRTRALSHAWRRRGDVALAQGRHVDALAALARAYVEANDPDDVEAALRALAAVFAATGDSVALARATSELRARACSDPELDRWDAIAALGLRDLASAVGHLAVDDPWRPPLTELARGRSLGWAMERFDPLPPGDPATFAAGTQGGETRLLDRTLATLERKPGWFTMIPGTPLALSGGRVLVDVADPSAVLWRTDHPVAEVASLALGRPGPSGLIDAARRAPLITYTWPHHGFLRIGEPPTAGARPAHPATHALDAPFTGTWSGDLDGDGRDELFALFDPPASDLRVFQADERGELRLVHRRPNLLARGITAVRRGPARLLAVAREDAPGAGYELLRWTGGALVPAWHVSLPAREGEAMGAGARPLVAGDVDGDGADELFHRMLAGERTYTRVVRGAATDAPSWRQIGGLEVVAAVQADADPADEVVARLWPDHAAWLLGTGDAAPPDLRVPADVPVRLAGADEWTVERVAHAEMLATMGQPAAAAAALADLAPLTADEPTRAAILGRAAALWVVAGDDPRAVEVDRHLATDPHQGSAALARSAAALARLGRHAEAHAAATALVGRSEVAADDLAAAARVASRLAPLVADAAPRDLADGAWRTIHPAGLRRVPGHGLEIAATAGPAALAEVPLAWTGEAIAVEAEFLAASLESGACLTIGLDAGQDPWLDTSVCGGADERSLRQRIVGRVRGHGDAWLSDHAVASAAAPRRVVLRIAWFADGIAEFTADDEGRAIRWTIPDVRPPAGPPRLVVAARTEKLRPALSTGVLRRVRLFGARPVARPDESAWDQAARHLVDDDPRAAQAVLGDIPAADLREHMIRLATRERLGDGAGLARAVDLALPALLAPAGRPALALLVRTRPLTAAALNARAGAALLPALADVWSGLRAHADDPATRSVGLAGLHWIDAAPTTPAERDALRRLWLLRGTLAAREGRGTAAIRDFEAALTLEAPFVAADRDVADAHAELARLYAADAPALARQHAQDAIAVSPTPERTYEALAGEPALAGLLAGIPPP